MQKFLKLSKHAFRFVLNCWNIQRIALNCDRLTCKAMAKIITLSKYLNEKKTKNATATASNLLYYDTFDSVHFFLTIMKLRMIKEKLGGGLGWSDVVFQCVWNNDSDMWWNADKISGAGLVCIDESFPAWLICPHSSAYPAQVRFCFVLMKYFS